MEGVAVVRLMHAPTLGSWSSVAEEIRESIEGAEDVVLTGPGWRSSVPACEMTATIVRDLEAAGVSVSIEHAA